MNNLALPAGGSFGRGGGDMDAQTQAAVRSVCKNFFVLCSVVEANNALFLE
jgi:hypothetical protein